MSEARAELPARDPLIVAPRRPSPGGARPFGQVDRLLATQFVKLFLATLGGVVLLYLTVDFADRAGSFWGRAWGKAVLELYWNKAAVVAHQLAPAALIIAAALLATLLARRGELTALFALGVRPWRLAAPIAVLASFIGIFLFFLGERVVVRADARAEEIQVKRFNRWGDWATYHAGSSWLRGENGRIFHLGPQRNGGWEPATVLEIVPPFRLARRIDARRLEPAGTSRWRFIDAVETRYALSRQPGGIIAEIRADVLEEHFPETAEDLELRGGRPRQLTWRQLREQIERRAHLGQPVREWQLAFWERVAHPITAIPAALAGLGLILWRARRRRRLPLAGAAALGIALSMALWAVSVVVHAAALSGGLPAWSAGIVPPLFATAMAAFTFWRS
ncbi:MAG TPA: LptF/LptG family permease [Myxococcales bacterium]|nr:LptF/LptG family permease [Myxococcales bacterium]